MRRTIHKWGAALLAVCLLLMYIPTFALAAESSTITLRTAEDLIAFSQNCSLDTWSQGKTVVLAGDIDLTGCDFSPIPTFGGTFDGQGYKITGLSLTGSGSVQGLFRYIQKGGTVRNLTVSGTIAPSGSKHSVGGIAGSNQGTIASCTFQGTVRGSTNVGGIVGVNEGTGRLIDCSVSGNVSGEHYIGGAVGQNLGSVVRCRSSAAINTTEVKSTVDLESLDLTQLNSTENVPTSTDIGGIAGFSAGVLQSCQNEGTVGYPHVGYNVGGIAGRQSGYMDGCVNTGAVYGRKDVGGVAGQLEPDLLVKYDEDALARLWRETDTLQSLMDQALTHAGDSADALSASLSDLTEQAGTVKDRVGDLSDAVTDWANGNIDVINDLSARISWALDQMEPALDSAQDAMDSLADSLDDLESALKSGELAADLGEDAAAKLKQAASEARSAFSQTQEALAAVRTGTKQLLAALHQGDEAAMTEALKTLAGAIATFESAVDQLRQAAQTVQGALADLAGAGSHGQSLLQKLRSAADVLSDSALSLADMADQMGDVVHDLAQRPAISFTPLDSSLTARGDDLQDALSGLLDQADGLNHTLSASSDTILSDLQAINRQLGVIVDVLQDAVDSYQDDAEQGIEGRFEDISDQAAEDLTTGVISSCRNEGTVEGDINVAGVAGSMAVEYDFDPEDDLTKVGERSLNFRYQARAVIRQCVNQGAVTSKKDCAGGIAGRMDLGSISGCESYGPVSSTDGDYVGGIAGASYAVVRSSWSKCRLSGGDYIGGITGYGTTVLDCRALVLVDAGTEYLGAVAGDMDPDGTLEGNRFVQQDLAGVDGISYAGKAEPVAFSDLEAAGGMPQDFARFTLTFVADGETVAEIPFSYGDSLDSLPEIPAKAGCSARWPALDWSFLTFSQTLEAEYTPYASALSDGSALPQVLVDGSFSSDSSVRVQAEDGSWSDRHGQTHSGTIYTVTVTDPALENPAYTIHYRLENPDRSYTLWVQTAEGWQTQDYELDGSYLLLPSDGSDGGEMTFCVLPSHGWLLWAAVAAAVLALAGTGAFFMRQKRRRQRQKV